MASASCCCFSASWWKKEATRGRATSSRSNTLDYRKRNKDRVLPERLIESVTEYLSIKSNFLFGDKCI